MLTLLFLNHAEEKPQQIERISNLQRPQSMTLQLAVNRLIMRFMTIWLRSIFILGLWGTERHN